MAQSPRGGRDVGDYVVGEQIGFGSFSVVWHARHKVHGTEVAIKEIVTGGLNKKLHDSLMYEIFILKQINHPNIVRLHDIIEETGRIHIVLEYCRGGDLSMFIQKRKGRVTEATAKHFMQQLVAGLQILHQNHLMHRDLKPQNLLLSTDDDSAVLKIADFGFARSLQPRGLAETLCGSPLYMAPEIMQLQKYDAKADLWSVGAILFQLVTGKPPFTGSNQIQLLQNILRSTELHFPPDKKDLSPSCIDLCKKLLRCDPEERLTFEEFFSHPFLSERRPNELFRSRQSTCVIDSFSFSKCNPVRNVEESFQEDCLPFSLDDDCSGPDGSPSFVTTTPSVKPMYGFYLDPKVERKEVSNSLDRKNLTSSYCGVLKPENTCFRLDSHRSSEGNSKGSSKCRNQRSMEIYAEDSLELIYQDYVLVSGSTVDVSSSSARASKLSHLSCSPVSANVKSMSSAPVPIIGATGSRVGCCGSLESHSSAPSGTSQGSMGIAYPFEQPSTYCMTRIKSLRQIASSITELVNEKIKSGMPLEAFSIELVILAIRKQALHICHTQAVSAVEGSPTQLARLRVSSNQRHGSPDAAFLRGPQEFCSQIEGEFLQEVGNAEELAKVIEPGNMEMPDAMEIIYQYALDLGRCGAVDECLGDTENATVSYTKAVRLLVFLLVEAPALILNPPFSLTSSDRYRLQSYMDVLNNRQSHLRSQRMALLKSDDRQCQL